MPSIEKTILVWYRMDLRINDNPALYCALEEARANTKIIALYLIDLESFDQWSPLKNDFIIRTLETLGKELGALGIPFIVKEVTEYEKKAVETIKDFSKESTQVILYYNRDLGITQEHLKREQDILKELSQSIGLRHFDDDQCIVPPGYVMTGENGNKPYNVFTPFSKKWAIVIREKFNAEKSKEKEFTQSSWTMKPLIPSPISTAVKFTPIKTSVLRVDCSKEWPAGEQAAKKRLEVFLKNAVKDYHERRNDPCDSNGCSRLSAYQTIGAISMKECFRTVSNMPASRGRDAWINELAWRDFYRHIWYHYEHVRNGDSFKQNADLIEWRLTMIRDEKVESKYKNTQQKSTYLEDLNCWVSGEALEDFRKWQAGKTGYPIVDAGMRQLFQSGFMPNRLRMITASFLTKDLLIDWRLGERHFHKYLVDLDEPSNNGGWQWSASTGTDAQPYFRVFSPILQAERYDSEAKYTKTWCPELEKIAPKDMYTPKVIVSGYYAPIVDHSMARQRAIQVFKTALQKS